MSGWARGQRPEAREAREEATCIYRCKLDVKDIDRNHTNDIV